MGLLAAAAAIGAAAGSSAAAGQAWDFRGVRHRAALTSRTPTICEREGVKQYAGTYDIDGGAKSYFYWAFGARNATAAAPTILWMTGGPGCSSLTALFGENGPCTPNAAGDGTVDNAYSWNSFANVIYIDQPAGVGFSTGTMDDKDETGVAEDMYQFLQAFFADHADWNTEFFATGESYGGHYVPATAHRVWKGAQAGEGIKINLKGVAVGNGLTDPEIQYNGYYAQDAYNWSMTVQGHATITLSQYEAMMKEAPTCVKQIHSCNNGGGSSVCKRAQSTCNNAQIGPYQNTGLNPYDIREKCKVPPLCYDFSNIETYLNSAAVQKELGVSGKWESCNYAVNADFGGDWMLNYQGQLPDLLGDGVRVLIYAGDVDFICNWIGNKAWTLALPWGGKSAFNAAADADWTSGGKVAGVSRSAQGLTFLQIHDAGHMVPMNQPAVALDMIDHLVHDKPW